MGARQVLRVAVAIAVALAAPQVASARPGVSLRLAAAQAAHEEPIVLVDLRPDGNGGDRDASRAKLADDLDRVSGLHVQRGGMLDVALAGGGGDDVGLATQALDVARGAYGALDCAKARPAAERAALIFASRQAAGVGGGDGSAPRAAWAYVLLCADRDRDHAGAAVAAAMLRALGVTSGGDVGVGDDTWAKYPDVDARTAALVELTVKAPAGAPASAHVWIDLADAGPAPATVTVVAGDHVVAVAAGDLRGAARVTVDKSGSFEVPLEDRGNGGTWGDVATAVRAWRAAATIDPQALATVMRRLHTRFVFALEGGGTASLWVLGPGDASARKVATTTVDDPVAMGALVNDRVAAWDGRAPDPDRQLLVEDRTQGPGRSGSTVDKKDHWWVYASLIGAVVVGGIVVYAHDNATDHQRIELRYP